MRPSSSRALFMSRDIRAFLEFLKSYWNEMFGNQTKQATHRVDW